MNSHRKGRIYHPGDANEQMRERGTKNIEREVPDAVHMQGTFPELLRCQSQKIRAPKSQRILRPGEIDMPCTFLEHRYLRVLASNDYSHGDLLLGMRLYGHRLCRKRSKAEMQDARLGCATLVIGWRRRRAHTESQLCTFGNAQPSTHSFQGCQKNQFSQRRK